MKESFECYACKIRIHHERHDVVLRHTKQGLHRWFR